MRQGLGYARLVDRPSFGAFYHRNGFCIKTSEECKLEQDVILLKYSAGIAFLQTHRCRSLEEDMLARLCHFESQIRGSEGQDLIAAPSKLAPFSISRRFLDWTSMSK